MACGTGLDILFWQGGNFVFYQVQNLGLTKIMNTMKFKASLVLLYLLKNLF